MLRRFIGYRPNPPAEYYEQGAANLPDEPQYEGVVFSDGTVAVRWVTQYRSHSIWASWSDFYAIHGHPEYGTKIDWLDERDETPDVEAVDRAARVDELRKRAKNLRYWASRDLDTDEGRAFTLAARHLETWADEYESPTAPEQASDA